MEMERGAKMKAREPLPLKYGASFDDLVFLPHKDGDPLHLHALHRFPDGRKISVTRGGQNFGTEDAPYEMQDWDGEIRAPLTAHDVTDIIATATISNETMTAQESAKPVPLP